MNNARKIYIISLVLIPVNKVQRVREEVLTLLLLVGHEDNQQGGFTDLCRGPHLKDTGAMKAYSTLRNSATQVGT